MTREVPEREGRPIVGVDLGGGRAWSCRRRYVGRTEGLKRGPLRLGYPDSLDEQERRDRVPSWYLFRKLFDMGQLEIAEGLERTAAGGLVGHDTRRPGESRMVVVLDRFRLAEFEDAVKRGARLEPRVSRWSEASFDIRALRQMALDGPLAVDEGSQALLATSLSQAMVKSDDRGQHAAGEERSPTTPARDDVAQGLVLAAGALARKPKTADCALAGASRVSWRAR